jgi:hypothetical protein
MIAAGLAFLARELAGRPVDARPAHWAAIVLGGLIIILSFTLDRRNLLAGGMPAPFSWWIFAAGIGLGLAAFLDALRRRQ